MEARQKLRIKKTPQRMAIIEYLEGNTSHPSAADVAIVVVSEIL
jgi:Fe2+ or Zn2+ uptake regulation protein